MSNNITILEDNASDIKFIYHISDIHIKAIISDDLKEHYLDIIEKVCDAIVYIYLYMIECSLHKKICVIFLITNYKK